MECLVVIAEGGNPERIRESQKKRYAPVEAVDEVIALFEDHKKSKCPQFDQRGNSWLTRTFSSHSPIRRRPGQSEGQRSPKTNWAQEEGR